MKLFSSVILTSIIFFSASVFAENQTASERLLLQIKNIKTLQANFIQENYDAKNNLLQKQTGSFKVTNSGEFIWSISAPYEQKIISDGKILKVYDPDLEQLTLKSLDKKAQVIPLLLFGGEGESITQQYEITDVEKNVYELRARDKNSLFATLQVRFKNDAPLSMSIIDSMNQGTLIKFEGVVVNQSLKASLFQFETPAGTDVIDER